MITSTLLTRESLTVVFDNVQTVVRKGQSNWDAALAALRSKNELELRRAMNASTALQDYSDGHLRIEGDSMFYKDRPLHTIDAQRVIAFRQEGLPFDPILKYIEKCRGNTSRRTIEALYPWIEHCNVTITDTGNIIGYKGVRSDYYSVQGNLDTVVLRGTVDADGHILNKIGEVIEVERSSVCDNFDNTCGAGLHIGSLVYAKGWGERVMLVEFNPAHVVCVPNNSDAHKVRVTEYIVRGEYTGPMPDTLTREFSDDSNEASCPDCDCGGADCSEEMDKIAKTDVETPKSELEKAAENAGIFSNTNDRRQCMDSAFYLGMKDFGSGIFPRYLPGDVEGADSPLHADVISAYISGYTHGKAY